MPVLAGATDRHPSAFLVATPTGPVLLISDPTDTAGLGDVDVDRVCAKMPQLPVLVLAMPLTLVGSFDG